jgi:hypothetical protein
MIPLAVVYYGWHNATDDAKIRKLQPEVLIDNTPAGLWHGNCDPKGFPGTQIYSYITASYSKADLAKNLAFVDAIALEGTYGVFMDELSPQADAYLQTIYARCQAKGVKLMVNPGMSSINTNIYQYADFVMTDEHYTGRNPASSEAGNLAKTVVIGFNAGWTPTQAAGYSNTAWTKGFRYTWHEQVEYTTLPASSWLDSYAARLVPPGVVIPPPVTPPTVTLPVTVTVNGVVVATAQPGGTVSVTYTAPTLSYTPPKVVVT